MFVNSLRDEKSPVYDWTLFLGCPGGTRLATKTKLVLGWQPHFCISPKIGARVPGYATGIPVQVLLRT